MTLCDTYSIWGVLREPLLICSVCGLVVLGSVGCTNGNIESDQDETIMSPPPLEEVLRTHRDSLMTIPGVVGVGQALCDDQPCIRVFVEERTLEIEENVPDTLDGHPVDVLVTGRIEPRSQN